MGEFCSSEKWTISRVVLISLTILQNVRYPHLVQDFKFLILGSKYLGKSNLEKTLKADEICGTNKLVAGNMKLLSLIAKDVIFILKF